MVDMLYKMQMCESQFSNTESKVYRIIAENPSLVKQYTITAIAGFAETSTSAVLRFCQTLGYQGYKDFRYDMLQYLSEREHEINSDEDTVSKIASIYSFALSAIRDVDRTLLDHLVDDILFGKVIYTMGIYRSFLPAQKLRFNLEDYGILTISAGDSIAFTHLPTTMDEECTAIIFSTSGHTYNFQNFLSAAKGYNPKLWLITCNPNAKMKKYVSNVIVLPTANIDVNYPLEDHPIMMAFVEILSTLVRTKQLEKA